VTGPIVRKIDHVYVPLDDARGAHTFLCETLGLREIWPFTEYGRFASGGVSFGNANLESLQANDSPTGRVQHPARIIGIAFEPIGVVDDLVAALDERGIAHTAPAPFSWGDGTPGWTTVGVEAGEATFFCKYHFGIDGPDDRPRGPLGVVRMEELVVAATDLDAWRKLLEPASHSPEGTWELGAGPSIRLTSSDTDRVEHLVVGVRSVEKALAVAGELGIAIEDEATLVPEQLGGLRLVLR
jgi:hypothetical protein